MSYFQVAQLSAQSRQKANSALGAWQVACGSSQIYIIDKIDYITHLKIATC